MYECPKCCNVISAFEMKWANPDTYCPSCSKTLVFNFKAIEESEDMTLDEEKREILGDFTNDELEKELDERKNSEKIVRPDAILAEYTCPECGIVEQVDMCMFDDEGIYETYCGECNKLITIDLV
jgi:predicted nucleic acid-binding Zn ribbon protein